MANNKRYSYIEGDILVSHDKSSFPPYDIIYIMILECSIDGYIYTVMNLVDGKIDKLIASAVHTFYAKV